LGETIRQDLIVPIPVRAIVRNLPGLNMFMTTSYFYYARYFSPSGNPFDPTDNLYVNVFMDQSKDDISEAFDEAFEAFINRTRYAEEFDPEYFITSDSLPYQAGAVARIDFDPVPSWEEKQAFFDEFTNSNEFKSLNVNFYRKYPFDLPPYDEYDRYDQLAINFSSLDKVEEMKNMLKEDYEIELDMAQIEARKNYNFVTRLTLVISFFLIGFSILSICLFISHVFEKHLDKIKMNIGTFKAFGLDNTSLRQIYLSIIFLLVFVAVVLSLLLAALFGYLGGVRGLIYLFNFSLEPGENYFSLFDWPTALATIIVLLIIYFVLRGTAKRIIGNTPGDLIYNRT
jgi:ABC-type antimicrobial peptide transport system permease subunit